jgi:hypothetical protein
MREPLPIWITFMTIRLTREVVKESHPWSKRSPRGEEFPVFLAYFPSISSSIRYIK